MEWVGFVLREASKTKGNSVKRWKIHDHASEFFCSRNFNKSGRYISIINMQGKRKAVIIIPEWSFNSGWLDIAFKITNFINAKRKRTKTSIHRNTEKGLLYADAVRNNKWTTREMNAAKTHRQGNSLVISDEASRTQNELLARCVVGSLPEEIPNVILSEIRQWSTSTWKHLHGVNIYEMGQNQFLFELPTKKDADHVVKGTWFWKNHKFLLNWWSSTSNAITENLKQVVDQTEEETELRNHIKWARLKVKGDEISVPKVVELKHDGKIFRIQVWIEALARVLTEGPRENLMFVQRFIEKPYNKRGGGGLVCTYVTGHVGTSESQGNLNYTAVQTCESTREEVVGQKHMGLHMIST
ncbi:hypothetical protein MTR67_000806 [Solanum verrucosum]|uniref:DUF4283 domain-containing protein n=1 Tax=Solanum verrucosum TaxID=315347 RepID=A0AAF0PRG5_SOLVR|nr:hypothetical protein MTR67_000806 [Solanum verrucosum]